MEKEIKAIITKLNNLFIKINSIFTDIYITKTGYIISMNIEKPFLVHLSSEYIDLVDKYILNGKNIIHITNTREYKKEWSDTKTIEEVIIFENLKMSKYIKDILPVEHKNVIDRLDLLLGYVNNINNWKLFKLDNEKMEDIFNNNKHIEYVDEEIKNPPVIITKELMPTVTLKTSDNILMTIVDMTTIDEKYKGLYMLVFNIESNLFTLYSINNFIDIGVDILIPVDKK